jgi:hypothetical protein
MSWLFRIVAGLALAFGLAGGLIACGGKTPSAKAEATELEQAFGLKGGAAPLDEATPAGLASRAVGAMRAEDWAAAMAALERLRRTKALSPDQARAVHNASANIYVRVAELAGRGDAQAQQVLEALKKSSR